MCRCARGQSFTVATGKKQVSALVNQLGDKVSICVEPARRDTFPAIALAALANVYIKASSAPCRACARAAWRQA